MTREGQPPGFDPRQPDPEQPTISDKELVEQAKINPETFGGLYERYLSKVYSYHFYRLGSPQDAEDATQETFINAFTHLPTYEIRSGVPFGAWIFRIAHNENVNTKRGRHRKPTVSLDQDNRSDNLLSPFDQPEDLSISEEEKERLRALVRELTPDEQDLILGKFVFGLSNKEIAKHLEIKEGATKARLVRLLIRLKIKFNKQDDVNAETDNEEPLENK